jgi:hypothetical protein
LAEIAAITGPPHETEARAEEEAAAKVTARSTSAQGSERPLEQHGEARKDQHRRDDEQERDREVAQEVLRQVQLLQQPRRDQGEDRKARDEAGDDRVRPAATAARASCEEDRQHREHARRDRGHDSRAEGDWQEQEKTPVHGLELQSG